MLLMAKTTSINLRISPELRREIELLADYHGLTMSSYAHSVLVKAIRKERAEIDLSGLVVSGKKLAPNSARTMIKPVTKGGKKRRTG